MRIKQPFLFAIRFLPLILLLITGCPQLQLDRQERTLIVTSFLPVYSFTAEIAGDLPSVDVELLDGCNTISPHDISLTPGDMRQISRADIIVRHGLGIDGYFSDKVIESAGPKPGLKVVELMDGIPSDRLLLSAMDPPFDESKSQGDPSDSVETHNAPHELRNQGFDTPNMHAWVSPSLAALEVRHLTAELARAIPEHADSIRARGDRYAARLDSLTLALRASFAEYVNRRIITNHDGFRYFARDLGLEMIAVIERGHGIGSSPRDLQRIFEIIEARPPAGIFVEPRSRRRIADYLSHESGIPVYELDPAAYGAAYPGAYFDAMSRNGETLLRALRGVR